ncbi:MAG: glycosyltransferase family 39 protein [Bacteroidetes bacterium]|nr:glycosyltransferase family 39 protein [Bacteroidota bacterium]
MSNIKTDNIIFSLLNKHRNVLFIVFILLLNLVIRGIYLNANPIELDESFSIFYSQMGIREIISSLNGGNNPPLYEIFLHFWIKIFGISSFAVRFPSLLFSVINVYIIYLISTRFLNSRVALLSVILVTFSNYHLFFSHEARVYPLFALLTTISFYLLFLIIERKYSKKNLFLLFITYVSLVFSHYFGIFVIAFQAVLLFSIAFHKRDILKKYFIIILGLLLTFAYYVPIVFHRFIDSSQNGTWLKPVENIGNLFDIIFMFSNNNRWIYLLFILLLWSVPWKFFFRLQFNKYIKWALLFGIIPLFFLTSYSIFFKLPLIWRLTSSHVYIFGFIAIILIVYIFQGIKKNISTIQFIILGWFLFPLLFFFLVSFIIPVFLDRYLIFIMPAFYIVLALSMNYLFQNKVLIYLGSIILISISVFSFNPNVSNNRYANEIINQTKKFRTSESKIIICPEQYKLTFAYHYNIEYFKDYKNLMSKLNKDKIFLINNQVELNNIIGPLDNIIYIDAHSDFLYPKNGIFNKLNHSYDLIKKIVFQDSTKIYEFGKLK